MQGEADMHVFHRDDGRRSQSNQPCTGTAPPAAGAFTLIELLAVIAIVALLLAILAPSLRQVGVQARSSICQRNQTHTWAALNNYINTASEHFPPQAAEWGRKYPTVRRGSHGDGYIPLTAQYGAGLGKGIDGLFPNPDDYNGLWGCPETTIRGYREGWKSGAGAVRIFWNYRFGLVGAKTTIDDISRLEPDQDPERYTERTPSRAWLNDPGRTLAFADGLYYVIRPTGPNYLVFRHETELSLPAFSYPQYKDLWNHGALDGKANLTFADGHVETMKRPQYDDARAKGRLVFNLDGTQ